MFVLKVVLLLLSPFIVLYWLLKTYVRRVDAKYRQQNGLRDDVKIIAFFHPFCNSGGGGERVLWVALRALHHKYPDYHYVVYTGDIEAKPEEIKAKAKKQFQIDLNFDISFVYLKKRYIVGDRLYPIFTLLGQSIGSVFLGFEALFQCVPDVYIDSMGFSFTFPVFRYIGGSRVGAYVHYPTISTDMLQMVTNTKTSYNNRAIISNSRVLTSGKLLYYKLFAYLYGLIGRMALVVMVNSSWTQRHVESIWKRKARTVYPPCNTDDLKRLSLQNKKELQIVSIGQIRPEKNHSLQVIAFKEFIDKLSSEGIDTQSAKLVIIGSCRDDEDRQRLNDLKQLSRSLDIESNVEFKVNIPYEELKDLIEESSIGVHTMVNEHFGIGVVECLAAGLITLTHASGGPKLDLITDGVNGFLATDSQSFCQKLYNIYNLNKSKLNDIRLNARKSADRFSEQEFETLFLTSIEEILH
ncbi:unnamed protein product [Medioppia subpectinata]|uniref:GDP-Man:Man(3)GlcNAc(2)-PP-Dol alpha-1,2-mannosyltransferase n=1 Tax=Medioppia subpectinata TaxID=1979941 RepID=A0A7R9KC30_9ACAR|nr:unnamed protein product [Medioppia subpectinata]CAG2100708.1 unnamed protein product [Medioppia subpectinata]